MYKINVGHNNTHIITCAQRKDSSAKSDQRLPLIDRHGPKTTKAEIRHVRSLILAFAQRTCHFIVGVVLRLNRMDDGSINTDALFHLLFIIKQLLARIIFNSEMNILHF